MSSILREVNQTKLQKKKYIYRINALDTECFSFPHNNCNHLLQRDTHLRQMRIKINLSVFSVFSVFQSLFSSENLVDDSSYDNIHL